MGKKLVELGLKDLGYEFVNIDVSRNYDKFTVQSSITFIGLLDV